MPTSEVLSKLRVRETVFDSLLKGCNFILYSCCATRAMPTQLSKQGLTSPDAVLTEDGKIVVEGFGHVANFVNPEDFRGSQIKGIPALAVFEIIHSFCRKEDSTGLGCGERVDGDLLSGSSGLTWIG